MYKKDLYGLEEPARQNQGPKQSQPQPAGGPPASYESQPPYQDKQPYRDYDSYRYEGGGYLEPKGRGFDSQENRTPAYSEQWSPYEQQQPGPQMPGYAVSRRPLENPHPAGYEPRRPYENQHPAGYEPRGPYEDRPDMDYEEPPLGYDSQTHYEPFAKGQAGPAKGQAGPARYDEPPQRPLLSYDGRPHFEAEPYAFPPPASLSPEPPKSYGEPATRQPYSQGPLTPGYRPGQFEPTLNSDAAVTPPKPEAQTPQGEPVITTAPKPLPPPPRENLENDPAMKRQSVLTRVKMFENKRSVSVDRAKETSDPAGLRVGAPNTPPPMCTKQSTNRQAVCHPHVILFKVLFQLICRPISSIMHPGYF